MAELESTSKNTNATDTDTDSLRNALKKSYSGLSSIAVFSIFINMLKLAIPIYILQILDRVISSRSIETLLMLSTITIVAILVAAALEIIRQRMFVHWGNWIELKFGPRLFASGLNDGNLYSSSTSRMLRDVSTIRNFVSGPGLIAWIDVVWTPVFIAIIFLISPILGNILLVCCLVAFVLGIINERTTRDAREATYDARKDNRDWVSSAERNQESIGSLMLVNNLTDKWSRTSRTRLNEAEITRTVSIYFSESTRLVGSLLRISIIGVGIWLVIEESLTLGAVIAAGVLSRTAYSQLRQAMLKWQEMQTAKKAYYRIKNALPKEATTQVSIPKSSAETSLVLENVSFRYPNQANSIFRRINLLVNPGEVLCIVGLSATGKTTIARLVSGLLEPRSGHIRLGEIDVHRLQQKSTYSEIGFLPQSHTLFQGTVRENIARMAHGNIDEVIKVAKFLGIHEAILKLPHGYDTEISEHEPLLSSGQRKCIALARTLYGSPKMVVMDEPAPHLDRVTKSALKNALLKLKSEGVVVIITTQSRWLTRYADKILLLHEKSYELFKTGEQIDKFRQRYGTSYRRRNRRRQNKPSEATAKINEPTGTAETVKANDTTKVNETTKVKETARTNKASKGNVTNRANEPAKANKTSKRNRTSRKTQTAKPGETAGTNVVNIQDAKQ
jgi:PrtD family type I secretion system ABC transporter